MEDSTCVMAEFVSVGKKMRDLREKRVMSQKELADKAGVEVTRISKYENGAVIPNNENLLKIGLALGVTIDYFIEYKQEFLDEIDEYYNRTRVYSDYDAALEIIKTGLDYRKRKIEILEEQIRLMKKEWE